MPVEFVRGEGARMWDAEGREYLDFLCGISVTNLGHCHPRVVAAVREQVGTLMHASNLFYTEPAMRLGQRLSASSLGGKVFFCNSGAEAVEAAIKLARKARRGGDVVVVHGAFHGRTYGALSATPQEAKQAPFAPLVPGFRAVGVWTYDQRGVRPDAITVAKALGGGLPIGALVTGERLADVLAPGDHGSTFAGGPVVASAALAALKLTDDPRLLAAVGELGERLAAGLEQLP